MAFMGPSHWLSDPDGAEAASEKEFFGWTGTTAIAQPFLRWRPKLIVRESVCVCREARHGEGGPHGA